MLLMRESGSCSSQSVSSRYALNRRGELRSPADTQCTTGGRTQFALINRNLNGRKAPHLSCLPLVRGSTRKQTCRWHVCRQRAEQSMIATRAEGCRGKRGRRGLSLPPSKIIDFCHLPRQREARVRRFPDNSNSYHQLLI